MAVSEQWREVSRLLEQADEVWTAAQTADELVRAGEVFQKAEETASALLQQFPEAAGKQPYEGDYRTTTAGRLLCGVLSRIQQLRAGDIPKDVARKEIQEFAVKLLNLRADHGRFFDHKLNDGINKVEQIYQKLLRQSVSPD